MVLFSSINMICARVLAATDPSKQIDEIESITSELTSTDTTVEEKTNFIINYINSQQTAVLDFFKRLAICIVIFFLGRFFLKLMMKLIRKSMEKADVDIGVRKFVLSLSKVLLYMLLIFIIAGIMGVAGSTIVAVVGSAGLAIGLALQGSLSNFAGGVLILLLKPFSIGDYISTTEGAGYVKSIDICYTRIETFDKKIIVLPNSTLSNIGITNASVNEKRYLIIDFTASNKIKTEYIRKTLLKAMKDSKFIIDDPENMVIVDENHLSYSRLQAKMWIYNKDYWDAYYLMQEKIRECISEKPEAKA